jgi:hypothetical protein
MIDQIERYSIQSTIIRIKKEQALEIDLEGSINVGFSHYLDLVNTQKSICWLAHYQPR